MSYGYSDPLSRGWKLFWAGVVAFVVVVVSGLIYWGMMSGYSTKADEVILHYNGGAIIPTDESFEDCYGPTEQGWDGPGDNMYTYPYGQRTAEFGTGDDADFDPITVVSKDQITMTVTGVATFALNTDCDTLRQFHERIGLKYKAYTADGWVRALNAYMKQPLDKAMDAASKLYGYQELYANPDVKEAWEDKVGELAAVFIHQQAGGDFFCNPEFTGDGECGNIALTIQAPVPPETMIEALTAKEQARLENEAQKEKNATVLTEAEGLRRTLALLDVPLRDYTGYLAIQKGMVFLPGSNVPLPLTGTDGTTEEK